MSNPIDLVKTAVAKGELDRMLLGEPQYWFQSKYSYAPGPTDVSSLIDAIYICTDDIDILSIRSEYIRALWAIVEKYEGIDAVSSAIFTEAYHRREQRLVLGIPLEELAERLRSTIARGEDRLLSAPSWIGFPSRFQDIRQLSHTTTEYGGPAFCD